MDFTHRNRRWRNFKFKSRNDDWFPPGQKNSVGLHQSITEMKQNGFITKIPNLNKGEKLHIQYVTAYDRNDKKKSKYMAGCR